MTSATKYDLTDEVLKKLRPAMAAALPDVTILVNPPEDGEDSDAFDESTDDEIAFRLADGSRWDHSIQSGPYGASVNQYSGEGADFAVETHGHFSYSTINQLVAQVIAKIQTTSPTAAPTP